MEWQDVATAYAAILATMSLWLQAKEVHQRRNRRKGGKHRKRGRHRR